MVAKNKLSLPSPISGSSSNFSFHLARRFKLIAHWRNFLNFLSREHAHVCILLHAVFIFQSFRYFFFFFTDVLIDWHAYL